MEINEQYMKDKMVQVEAMCEKNPQFVTDLVEAPDLNGFVGVLSGAGIAFEAEGMEALYMAIRKEVEADELDIEDLENVAGGIVLTGYLASLAVWAIVSAACAAFAYGVYKGSRNNTCR